MAIRVSWDSDAKRYVLAQSDGEWVWEDFYAAFKDMHLLIADVDYPVDLIIHHKVRLPPGNSFTHFKAAMKDQPANTGKIIVVPYETSTLQAFMKSLIAVFEKLYPTKSKIIMVDTLEEAQALVAQPHPQA